ncbi:retrovirus-related pol polyprotein from transposon TNT 1-94 [Tanacetum coccineum]
MTRSSNKDLIQPFDKPERVFHSNLKLFKTSSLDYLSSQEFNLFSEYEDQSKGEVTETMTETTMEEYMTRTREGYGTGIARPKIKKDHFELKGQFLKKLHDKTFSGLNNEDANEHIEKVLEIVDLFHIPNITQDQVILRAFLMSLSGAASRWLRNELAGSIKTWETLKENFLSKYCPPTRTAKKKEEINNFQQDPDETLYQALISFYKGLDVPTRQILDSKGAIPSMKVADAKKSIQEMANHFQKWHNGTSTRCKSTETSVVLAAIQAKLNNLGREIKKVNEKMYDAQFGVPFQQGRQYKASAPRFYQRNNGNPSYQERRQTMEESLSKLMAESARRHEENSNLIKEIRASMDVAIRNQGALIIALEIQIGKMNKVLGLKVFLMLFGLLLLMFVLMLLS